MKLIFFLLFCLINAVGHATLYFQTYPNEINATQADAIIKEAQNLGINGKETIEQIESYALTPTGESPRVNLFFKTKFIEPHYTEQDRLYCRQIENHPDNWSCKKYTRNQIKAAHEEDKWIDVDNPHNFMPQELKEVITYANQVKPVSWTNELVYLDATSGFGFSACFGNTDYKISISVSMTCLPISKSQHLGINYFLVDWSAVRH